MNKTRFAGLSIQTVIYLNELTPLRRAFRAATHSAVRAVNAGVLVDWAVRWGDCSPEPALTDDLISEFEKEAARLGGTFTYTFFDANLGSAAGHNALAELASEELLMILNPDAELSPDCVEHLARSLDENVGSVEARQLPLEHPKDYDPATLETSWSSTACLLTRQSAFTRIRGFDSETFFLYCDDVDYSWRLRLDGWKVLYQPAATVFHDKRLTADGKWLPTSAEIYYSAEAALLLAYKYSRPDLIAHLTTAFSGQNPEQKKALAEFNRRRQIKKLPEVLDPDHRVATFLGGNYARHRF